MSLKRMSRHFAVIIPSIILSSLSIVAMAQFDLTPVPPLNLGGSEQNAVRKDALATPSMPVKSWLKTPDGLKLQLDGGVLGLQVYSPKIVRVQFAGGTQLPDHKSLAVLPNISNRSSKWKVTEDKHSVTLSTSDIRAIVNRLTGAVSFTDSKGRTILQESPNGGKLCRPGENATILQKFLTPENEILYGLGEHFSAPLMNWKQTTFRLQQRNTVDVSPVLTSNKGYSILWDNYSTTDFIGNGVMQKIPDAQFVKPDGKTQGIQAEYFLGDQVSGSPIASETVKNINYEYASQKPLHPMLKGRAFGAVWSAKIRTINEGWYTFYIDADQRVRMWLDGYDMKHMIIEDWINYGPTLDSARVYLKGNRLYDFKMEITGDNAPMVQLYWTPPAKHPGEVAWYSRSGNCIDYYFIYGPTIDQQISGYRHITGAVPLLPKACYGLWHSQASGARIPLQQHELLDVLNGYRKRGYPLDVIVQDFHWWSAQGAHTFNPVTHPDPKAMFDEIHRKNAKLLISIWPNFPDASANKDELMAKGLMLPGTDWYDSWKPEARKTYWEQVRRALYNPSGLKADGFWLDSSEGLVGGNPKELDISYSIGLSQSIYEGMRQADPNKRAFILSRSPMSGQQRYATVAWSGDIGVDFWTLGHQIPAGLQLMMARYPYWTTDTGGFMGGFAPRYTRRDPNDPSYRELFVRWYQYGALCPTFRVHSAVSNTAPWDFGPDAEKIIANYDRLRYRLMPYIYSQAWRVTNEGYTMMRGLAMDFPKDTQALEIPDQFMFGPAFLVNPVTSGVVQSEELIPAGQFTTSDGQPGLHTSWFSDQNLTQKVGETTSSNVDFQWSGAPRADMPEDHFSVSWDGKLKAPKTGTYDMVTYSDDGVRLWLDDKLIIDDWTNAPTRRNAAKFDMKAGTSHSLRLEFMENIGGAHLSLNWITPKEETKLIPSRSVYLPKTTGGWYDFWTGSRFPAGKHVNAYAPLDIMPLYIKAGSIVPMGPFLQYATEKPADPIELRIYAGADGQTILYEDDGETYNYEKGQHAVIPIRWNDVDKRLTIGTRQGTYPSMLQKRSFKVVLVSSNHGAGLQPEVHADRNITYNGKAVSISFGKTRQ